MRHAERRGIATLDDLVAQGLTLTSRQRDHLAQRLLRTDPVPSFAEAWAGRFVADKFGAATTHWSKLIARIERGVGNPCPLLLIGIPDTAVGFETPAPADPEVGDEVQERPDQSLVTGAPDSSSARTAGNESRGKRKGLTNKPPHGGRCHRTPHDVANPRRGNPPWLP